MENKINVAELLKDCPNGMGLYSPIFGDVYLDEIRPYLAVVVRTPDKQKEEFLYDGRFGINGECMLFPSKENRDWSKFHRPFKDGDIVTYRFGGSMIACIYKKRISKACINSYFVLYTGCMGFSIDQNLIIKDNEIRLATEEEKQKLFDAIKDNGYRWNEKTKTLEKLIESAEDTNDKIVMAGIYFDRNYYADEVELHLNNYEIEIRDGKTYAIFKNQKPKFKVGDIVQDKTGYKVKITKVSIEDECYGYESLIVNGIGGFSFNRQDDWELVPNKFNVRTLKPFDKVLVRDSNKQKWTTDFFSFIDKSQMSPFICSGHYTYQCIPYEKNEHLLGTANDCDEFYKTW